MADVARAQLGTPIAGPFDVQTSAGNGDLTGVAYAWSSYWVSGGPTMPGGPHYMYEYSTAGVALDTYATCPAMTAPGTWSCAVDYSIGICMVCTKPGRICTYCKDTNFDCVLTTTHPYSLESIAKDSASGLFYGTLGTDPITVFTVDALGTIGIVNMLPPSGKVVRGLAWDEVDHTLWAFCANNPNGGMVNLVEFNELDSSTGQLTGRTFMGNTNLPAPNLAAGCSIYHDVRNPGRLSIVALHRSNPDVLMVYSLDVPFACTGYPDPYCTAQTNSVGCVPAIASSGAPSATSGSGFSVTASNIVNNKTGLLFYGLLDRTAQPFLGGTLCVKTPLKRTPTQPSGGTPGGQADCTGGFALDMNAFAVGALGGSPDPALLVPGTFVRCQFWSRDPASPSTTNLTDALEYGICP